MVLLSLNHLPSPNRVKWVGVSRWCPLMKSIWALLAAGLATHCHMNGDWSGSIASNQNNFSTPNPQVCRFYFLNQPTPKYHTKGCSRSFADSPGARTLVFAAFEPFHSCEFRASIVRTPFCAILWRSPTEPGSERKVLTKET